MAPPRASASDSTREKFSPSPARVRRDHDVSSAQVGARGLDNRFFAGGDHGVRRARGLHGQQLELGRLRGGAGIAGALTQGDDQGAGGGCRINQVGAAVHRVVRDDALLVAVDAHGVHCQRQAGAGGETRGGVAAADGVRGQHRLGLHLCVGGGQRIYQGRDDRVAGGRGVGDQYARRAQFSQLLRQALALCGGGQGQRHGAAHRGGRAEQFARACAQLPLRRGVHQDQDRVPGIAAHLSAP